MIGAGLLALLVAQVVAQAVNIDFVEVGDAGNTADNLTGRGAVAYNYRISKYETTISQYAEFLNAVAATDTHGLYNTNMGSDTDIAGISRTGISGSFSYSVMGSGDRPIAYVSWNDAARFVNWMHNGQGAGDTETGVYDMSQNKPTASASANYWIPTEDEWYKAAYYDPSIGAVDDADNYWLYPTRNVGAPLNELPDAGNNANFFLFGSGSGLGHVLDGSSGYLTDGGEFSGSGSYYGTFDQGGNVLEWNEDLSGLGTLRVLRGGSWDDNVSSLSSSAYSAFLPTAEVATIGFRIASVPEPSSIALLGLGSLTLLFRRVRGS